MKKRFPLSLIICFIAFQYLFAQHYISGQLFNQEGQPLEFASIVLYPIGDSTYIRGAITSQSGVFKFENLAPGSYQLVVQMLGFEDFGQQVNLSSNVVLEAIKLKEETNFLNEIEVVAERSYLESRLGKKVLRIGQDLSNTGSNVLEALERIPSITTTERGGVQIRGSENVIIYINGKETKRKSSTLQFISADVLDRIEVITNPSAKYDAEGVAGIINLVYKKGKTTKLKLEGILNTALPQRIQGGFNASINRDQFSFYTNVSVGRTKSKNHERTTRLNQTGILEQYQNEIDYHGTQRRRILSAGFSYEKDTTISMSFEMSYDRWDDRDSADQINSFSYRDSQSPLLNYFSNQKNELEDEAAFSYSLNKVFGLNQKLQLLLTADGEDENNFGSTNRFGAAMVPEEVLLALKQSDETEKQRLYQGKIDYEAPLFNFGTFETGIKVDYIQYDIFQRVLLQSNTTEIPDNDFSVNLKKYATYFLQRNQFKKLEYSFGVRVEQFSSDAIQRSNQETFQQNYVRVFPSGQLNYLLPDQSHTIGFIYSSRINRPGFFDLNPFVSYDDPLNLETGNPDLKPELAHLFELNYHKNYGDLSADFTLYRRQTNDVIQSHLILFDNNQTLQTYTNFAKRIDQGMEGQINYQNKVFKTAATFTFAQAKFKDIDNPIYFKKRTTWGFRLQQQFNLSKHWEIDFSETYRAPRFEPQRKIVAQYSMDFSISKKFNQKRGSLTLRFTDVFNTKEFVVQVKGNDFNIEKKYKWQTRRLTLGLRYYIFKG